MFALTSKICETRLKTGWEASSASAVAIRWPNVPWRQPISGEWIAFHLLPGDGEQASLGSSKLERQYGLVMVQIFTPKNKGTRRALDLADIVGSLYRYRTEVDSGVSVIFRAPQMADVAERADQYQTNVKIEYQAEKVFS